MKKLLSMLVCLVLVLSCVCAAGEALTPETLASLGTKEDLAFLLGIDDPAQTRQMLAYLKNFALALPSRVPAAAFPAYPAEDGINCLSIEQARSLITPIVITAENWSEYVSARLDRTHVSYADEYGCFTDEFVDTAVIAVKEGYHFVWDSFNLTLTDRLTGSVSVFDGSSWPYPVDRIDGKYYVTVYSEDGSCVTREYNPEDYACVFADAVVYSYDLPKEYLYTEVWSDEEGDYLIVPVSGLNEAENEYEPENSVVYVSFEDGTGSEGICCVGYEGLGSYVYSDSAVSAASGPNGAEFTAPAGITLEKLGALTCKEELAELLGISSPDALPQLLAYLKNYYNSLPSANETAYKADYGVYNGINTISPSAARRLITPIVITADNWKDYIAPRMEPITCVDFDDDGNEIITYEAEPGIGIKEGYFYDSWPCISLVLRNNETGEVLEYDGNYWPEAVVYADGKYCTRSYDSGELMEFDVNRYTCLYADCVLYAYNLDEKLIYVDFYDEAADSFMTVPASEYTGTEESPVVYVMTGEGEDDVCAVGYSSLGSYVYTTPELN